MDVIDLTPHTQARHDRWTLAMRAASAGKPTCECTDCPQRATWQQLIDTVMDDWNDYQALVAERFAARSTVQD